MHASIPDSSRLGRILEVVGERARRADVFAAVRREGGVLVCTCRSAAAPAEYRVYGDAGSVWVGLFTPDRWLSHSIEADLLHTGDKLGELIGEELAELGRDVGGGGERRQGRDRPAVPEPEHFRDEAKMFTFRTATPVSAEMDDPEAAAVLGDYLLAYEAVFRELGDVDTSEG